MVAGHHDSQGAQSPWETQVVCAHVARLDLRQSCTCTLAPISLSVCWTPSDLYTKRPGQSGRLYSTKPTTTLLSGPRQGHPHQKAVALGAGKTGGAFQHSWITDLYTW